MKLLEFIELRIKESSASLSPSTTKKHQQLLQRLAEYAGDDVDIRKAQSSEFVKQFAEHLERSYAPDTVYRTLRDFRKFARLAISMRLVPNLDVFPEPVKAALAKCKSEDKDAEAINLHHFSSDLHTVACVERLMAMVSRSATDHHFRSPALGATEVRRLREHDYNMRCVALYLFGLLCYGIDLRSVITLVQPRERDGRQQVFIPAYGKWLPLSPAALKLVSIYNSGAAPAATRLFGVLAADEPDEAIDKKALGIERRVRRVLGKERISLLSTTVYDDWVSLATESGLPIAIGEQLIAASLTGDLKSLPEAALIEANTAFADSGRSLAEDWRMLRIFVSRLTASKLKEQIVAHGVLGPKREALAKIYDPVDALESAKAGSNPLSRFLFFKSTAYASARINDAVRQAAVLRDRATGRFAVIREAELKTMQMVLRDFRDDVELINRTEWLAEQQGKIKVGGKVRILDGSLAGHTATIVEVKQAAGDVERQYLLEFVQDNVTFKTRLPGVKLSVIE